MILSDTQLESGLKELTDWSFRDEKLFKEFKFLDFTQAFEFMSLVAIVAETINHHPEWSNVYNSVEINLVTHSEGGTTQLDIDLAKKIDFQYLKLEF